MKTTAIIAEFNPFHNGHKYLLEQARQITDADRIVVIMSGNYVQRGGPAFLDKFTRTKMALLNGADVVLELPFCYSMAKASHFAHGAISILNSLGCIDYLCFGCENKTLSFLESLADISLEEPPLYKNTLQQNLRSGISFSHAKELAMMEYLRSNQDQMADLQLSDEDLSKCLRSPNNILAIEYLSSLKRLKSKMQPVPVKRTDMGYHSLQPTEHETISLASATAIRKMILNNDISYQDYIPNNTHSLLSEGYQQFFPIVENDFSGIIGYRLNELIFENQNSTDNYLDVPDTMLNRIKNHSDSFMDVDSFIHTLNSKSITSAYIRRVIFQLMLKFTQQDFDKLESLNEFPYIRILGFNKKGAGILKSIKNDQTPIVTKLSTDIAHLSPFGAHLLKLSMEADAIYRMTAMKKYKQSIPNEHQMGLILMKD